MGQEVAKNDGVSHSASVCAAHISAIVRIYKFRLRKRSAVGRYDAGLTYRQLKRY